MKYINNIKFELQKGQSMIEVAIALAIATIIITALITSVLSSLDSAQYSKNLNLATQYSQEGIEAMRAKSRVATETYCMPKVAPPAQPPLQDKSVCNSTTNIDGFFQRKVIVENLSASCDNILSKVEVITSWGDGKCRGNPYCHESRLRTCVNNL